MDFTAAQPGILWMLAFRAPVNYIDIN